MMYRNRMLVAQTDLHLGTDYVMKGATFAATNTDAEYLIGQNKATEREAEKQVAAPITPPAPRAPRAPLHPDVQPDKAPDAGPDTEPSPEPADDAPDDGTAAPRARRAYVRRVTT